MSSNAFRALPSVAEVVSCLLPEWAHVVSAESLASITREEIDRSRRKIRDGQRIERDDVVTSVRLAVAALGRSRLEPVINATGVILHTNLGRAPVSDETAASMAAAAESYVSLEIIPEENARGGRMDEVSALMRLLTGAEATLVVNNGAAAILLALSALASGREAVVSRGEAVEIGGGFRIPDVMRQSGATLVEVGTTNRTYARDYGNAITENTAVLLKVHTSNFAVSGFTAAASIEDLAGVVRGTAVSLIEDLGSGALLDTSRFGLASEPTIRERLSAGVDLITASGDKLLGGPQAGIVAGRAELVRRIERHPLARAVRADKTSLAGVAATLRHYVRGDATERIPIWRMIATSPGELMKRAVALQERLAGSESSVAIVPALATVGGGSLPGQTLGSFALDVERDGISSSELARRLRSGTPRVFGHIVGDRLLLDLRTVLPEHDGRLAGAISAAVAAPE